MVPLLITVYDYNSGELTLLQDAVKAAYKCADPDSTTFSAELLEGYLALTDCTLSAIKTAAVSRHRSNTAAEVRFIFTLKLCVRISLKCRFFPLLNG